LRYHQTGKGISVNPKHFGQPESPEHSFFVFFFSPIGTNPEPFKILRVKKYYLQK